MVSHDGWADTIDRAAARGNPPVIGRRNKAKVTKYTSFAAETKRRRLQEI
jgi:hypothetical protein